MGRTEVEVAQLVLIFRTMTAVNHKFTASTERHGEKSTRVFGGGSSRRRRT